MRIAGLAVGMSLALACSDDAATGACGEVPELVMKFEPGELAGATYLWQRGEWAFVQFRDDAGTISLYTAERCGDGVPEQLVGPEFELDWASIVDTNAGSLLIGTREATGELLRIDRLDVPGRDAPQPIGRPDARVHRNEGTSLLGGGLLLTETIEEHGDLRPVGPERRRFNLQFYPGPGGLEAPPAILAEDLVLYHQPYLADRLYALNADHELLGIDGFGEPEVLQTGVRAVSFCPDGTQLAWQARGDGQSEPVYLRTLATGADVSIGVNDFTALSWEHPLVLNTIGTWRWSDDALALIGPEHTLVRAHARHDGALLPPPPPHLEVLGWHSWNPGRDLFLLGTVDAFMRIGLAWDPIAGTVVEWYRGELTDSTSSLGGLNPYRVGDTLYYSVWNPVDARRSALWLSRLDGRPAELVFPDYNVFETAQLPDGRILMRLEADSTAGRRLVLVDPMDGSRKLLARDIGTWGLGRDISEILYTRIDGPDAGVWARPL